MDKDAYTPNEIVQLKINYDNEACDEGIKHAKVRFIREITSTSAHGIEFVDKTVLIKRKIEGAESKQKDEKIAELVLDQIHFTNDHYLKDYRKKKPYIVEEMKEWFTALQPTLKTTNFECKYYAEVSFKHGGLTMGKKIPNIKVPIQIYYGRETVIETKGGKILEEYQPDVVAPHLENGEKELPPNPYLRDHPDLA
jgi:hypothetical protein